MWIYVVLDVDNVSVLKAFTNEEEADNFAEDYYERTGIDTRVEITFLRGYKK